MSSLHCSNFSETVREVSDKQGRSQEENQFISEASAQLSPVFLCI